MALVEVYQYEVWNVVTDRYQSSDRWGTPEVIKKIPGSRMIRSRSVEIDDSLLHSDMEGMTPKGYNPIAPGGFQSTTPHFYDRPSR